MTQKPKLELTWIGKDKRPKLAHSLWRVPGRNIKKVRRTAATAPTLEERLAHQKQQRVQEHTLFTIEWALR